MQQEPGYATRLGSQLQAAAGRQADPPRRLAQHGGQGGAAQPLLHRPKPIRGPVSLDQDHPPGIEAEGKAARRVRPVADPEHRPARRGEPAEQRGAEAGRGGVLRFGRHDLVQTAKRQTAAEGGIDLRRAKGKRRPVGVTFGGGDRAAPFQPPQQGP